MLTPEQVREIRALALAGTRLRVIAQNFGVAINVVSNAARGLTYAEVDGPVAPRRRKPLILSEEPQGCVSSDRPSSRHRRLAYVRAHGPVERSERVEATCGNPKCINPDHLVRAFDVRRPLTPELARDLRAAYRTSPRPLTRMGQEYGLSPYRAWFVLTSPKLDGMGEPPIPVRSRREAES